MPMFKNLFKEFRTFAMRGNVIDLAVGVIIGAAFGALVTSLVQDVLMPPLGWMTGGLDFKDKVVVIQQAGSNHLLTGKKLEKDVLLSYGKFINAVIQFLIQAIAIFMIVKVINSARRRFDREQAAAPPPPPPQDVVLLAEIRDILKAR